MDRIDWKILRYINEEPSTSRLANRLFITQPAVSYRLKKMEEEYGVNLFIRNNTGLSLTDAGKRLCAYTEKMLSIEEEIKFSVSSKTDEINGRVVIGSVASFVNTYLADQLKAFLDTYQQVSASIHINHTPILLRDLQEKYLSAAIVRGRTFDYWSEEKFEISSEVAVIVANEPITSDYLARAPFLSLFKESENVANNYMKIAEEWAAQHGQHLSKVSTLSISGDSHTILQFVKRGFGWTVVTSSKLQDSDGLYNKVLYDAGGNPFLYKTGLLYRKELEEFDVYRVYLQHFKNYFSHINPIK